jgi:hypothetical protein
MAKTPRPMWSRRKKETAFHSKNVWGSVELEIQRLADVPVVTMVPVIYLGLSIGAGLGQMFG